MSQERTYRRRRAISEFSGSTETPNPSYLREYKPAVRAPQTPEQNPVDFDEGACCPDINDTILHTGHSGLLAGEIEGVLETL